MAATTDPLSQALSLIKGDSDEYEVTVTEPDSVDPTISNPVYLDRAVDGTLARLAILRFAVKRTHGQDNVDALIYKQSYDSSEIRILDQATNTGKAEILIDVPDTADSDDPTDESDSTHVWDLEVNRQDEERAGASQVGTIDVDNGSTTVSGTGTAFTKAKVGDILQPLGVENIGRPALIETIVSDTELTVSHPYFTTKVGDTFEIRRNRRRTAAAGPWTLKPEVVSD